MNTQIYQEACDWLVTFRTGTPDVDSRRQLDAWLRKSPEHVRAYLEVTALWEDIPQHDPQRRVSAVDHIARARAESNVLTLPESSDRTPGDSPSSGCDTSLRPGARKSLAPAKLLAVAAGGALAVLGVLLYTHKGLYTTDIGEQRSITLTDGSTVNLNSRTRIRVTYRDNRRDVDLIEGQALFHVSKDRLRPFFVHSGATDVRAVGTEFDVYKRANGTTVTVLEGVVAIGSSEGKPLAGELLKSREQIPLAAAKAGKGPTAAPGEVLVSADEQVTVSGDGAIAPTVHPDLNTATAWTQHRLVFDAAPLSEVVGEFNRYNTRQLIVEGTELQNFAVVGVFSSADPSSLLRFLAAQPDIVVIQSGAEIHITKKK